MIGFSAEGGFRQLLFVKAGFQDRFDALVAVGFQKQGASASNLRPLGRIALYQPHDARTGAETLSGCSRFSMMQEARSRVVGAVFTCPVQYPGRGPF